LGQVFKSQDERLFISHSTIHEFTNSLFSSSYSNETQPWTCLIKMDKTPYILALDAGTSALKAVLYNRHGRVLASARKGYEYQTPQPGWAEGNPDDWWAALVAALAELGAGPWDLLEIKAVGLTGQMHTPVLLDQDGQVLPPAILWLDRRAAAETAELSRIFDLPPYHLNSTYTLPKLLWLVRHRPETIAKTHALLWPKDYLRYRLTGRLLTDSTEAAGAALLDWDQGEWAVERLVAIGLDPAILPPICPIGDDAGALLPELAVRLGLSAQAKVIVGAGDIISLIAGAPPKVGRLTCSLGSSAMVAAPLAKGQTFYDPQQRLYNNSVPPYRLINGVLSTSGASLTWAWHTLYGSEVGLDDILAQVQTVAAGADGLLFLPFLAGERSPYWSDSLRGGFYGLSLSHNRAQMVRAVMEGVAYNLRHLIDICEELGVPIQEIALSGGGAAVHGWPQIFADVCRRPVSIYVTQDTATRPLYAYCAHALDTETGVADALQSTFEREPQISNSRPDLAAVYEPLYESFRIVADFVANTILPAYAVE
jgi:xylulokinase